MSGEAFLVRNTEQGARLDLRVTPRASRSGVTGVRDGRLVVRVTAPPVDDAANAAVVEVLARHLHVARSAVRIVAGQASRQKSVTVAGLDAEEVQRRLSDILG